MDPITASLLVSAGGGLLGGLTNRLFNKAPSVPDYSAQEYALYEDERRKVNDILTDNLDTIQQNTAAAGLTGSASAQPMADAFGKSSDAQVSLAADAARSVARAENREKGLRFRQDQDRWINRSQAIGDLFGLGSEALSMQLLADEFGYDVQDLGGEVIDNTTDIDPSGGYRAGGGIFG